LLRPWSSPAAILRRRQSLRSQREPARARQRAADWTLKKRLERALNRATPRQSRMTSRRNPLSPRRRLAIRAVGCSTAQLGAIRIRALAFARVASRIRSTAMPSPRRTHNTRLTPVVTVTKRAPSSTVFSASPTKAAQSHAATRLFLSVATRPVRASFRLALDDLPPGTIFIRMCEYRTAARSTRAIRAPAEARATATSVCFRNADPDVDRGPPTTVLALLDLVTSDSLSLSRGPHSHLGHPGLLEDVDDMQHGGLLDTHVGVDEHSNIGTVGHDGLCCP
jgi:hypothetical protein